MTSSGGGVYPGYGTMGGAGRAIPGTTQHPSQGPIYTIIQPQDPTYGQMKAISLCSMRFLRMGLEWVLEWPQNDLI